MELAKVALLAGILLMQVLAYAKPPCGHVDAYISGSGATLDTRVQDLPINGALPVCISATSTGADCGNNVEVVP